MPYFPLPEIQINKASYPPLVPRPSLKKAVRPLFVLFPPPSICFFRICNWLKERKNKTKPTYLKAGMRKPAYLFYTVSKYFTYMLINVPCIFLASAEIAKRAFSPLCTLELPQELKRKRKVLMTRPAPFPKFWDSDLIGQGWDLGTSNFKSSPSDSSLKPKLRRHSTSLTGSMWKSFVAPALNSSTPPSPISPHYGSSKLNSAISTTKNHKVPHKYQHPLPLNRNRLLLFLKGPVSEYSSLAIC